RGGGGPGGRAGPRGDRGCTGSPRRRAGPGGPRPRPFAPGAVPPARPPRDPARLMRRAWRLPLSLSFTAIALVYMGIAAGLALLLEHWLPSRWLALPLAVLLPLPLLLYHVRRLLAPAHSLFRALAGSV